MIIKRRFLILFFLVTAFFPWPSQAARLYLSPGDVSVAPGDKFSVMVKIDTEEKECINVAEVILDFSESLNFYDFSVAESIFSLWTERPGRDGSSLINKDRRVVFSGGIPGGYCGSIPGDIGDSNSLGELIFDVSDLTGDEDFQMARINISPDSKVFISDGLGTEAKVEFANMNIRIDKNIKSLPDEWAQRLEEDNVLPEPFIIMIDEYDGKKFASFSTTDKQTGLDHYEILESRPDDLLPAETGWFGRFLKKETSAPDWVIATSPYFLNDQEMKSIIKVKAVDKAGNGRIVEYDNQELKKSMKKQPIWSFVFSGYTLGGLLIILIAGLFFILIKSRSGRRR